MTNAEIIFRTSEVLVKNGELGTVYFNGDQIPEPIHTFNGWKERGFKVKKGEHSNIKFPIWKAKAKKIETSGKDATTGDTATGEAETTSMFMHTAVFFTRAQVEPIEE